MSTGRFHLTEAGSWSAHSHPHHELLWGADGAVSVETAAGIFAVPSLMGLWIPAGTVHAVRSAPRTRFSCTYIDGAVGRGLDRTSAVGIGPLVRELLHHMHDHAMALPLRRAAEELVIGMLEPAEEQAVGLPVPQDGRLSLICRHLVDHPADTRSLEEWGRIVGSSVRNLSRLFSRETGMTFEQWRIHARMRVAVGLLSSGTPVGTVARTVGYRTPSAFVQAFRRTMGHTPGRYLEATWPSVDTGRPVRGTGDLDSARDLT
ncbi:AraC family transcriptional regulator [Plantibacter flavus]|uniref:helix-turn-helix transcriptional regulator n=1 Tax=Plantibacter flavus TaxID=150123 RepID=UPI003F5CF452